MSVTAGDGQLGREHRVQEKQNWEGGKCEVTHLFGRRLACESGMGARNYRIGQEEVVLVRWQELGLVFGSTTDKNGAVVRQDNFTSFDIVVFIQKIQGQEDFSLQRWRHDGLRQGLGEFVPEQIGNEQELEDSRQGSSWMTEWY